MEGQVCRISVAAHLPGRGDHDVFVEAMDEPDASGDDALQHCAIRTAQCCATRTLRFPEVSAPTRARRRRPLPSLSLL